jgi:predicted phosphoribosyltransferase
MLSLGSETSALGALVMPIPAGGVPVGAEIARRLELPLDAVVVSKVLLPWTTEAGYGAVAFDGTVRLNQELVRRFRLSEDVVQKGIQGTREKVRRRVRALRGDRPFPEVTERVVLLVDDGLASGFTMRVAVEALAKAGAVCILIAVPTGSRDTVEALACEVDRIYCANIRSGLPFAVADAYQRWSDVDEGEIARWVTDQD